MNPAHSNVAARLPAESSKVRRWNLAVLLIGGGSALLNVPSVLWGHRDLLSTYGGVAIAGAGFTLLARCILARAAAGRARSASSTKVI